MAKKSKENSEIDTKKDKLMKVKQSLMNEPLGEIYSVKERREWVLEQLLQGLPTGKIKPIWKVKFDKSDWSFHKDVTYCYKRIKAYMLNDLDDIMVSHVLQYDRNAQEAFDLGQINASNNALQAKEKLLKMHNDNNTFIQNNLYQLDDKLSVEDIKALLEKYSKDEDE